MDQDGRLWINPCFAQTEHRTVPFYHYDGVTSQLVRPDSLPHEFHGQPAISGSMETGWLYGFFRRTDKFFLFNPDTYQTRIFSLNHPEARILFTSHTHGWQMIIYAISGSEHLLYALEGDSARLLQVLPMEADEPEAYYRSAYLRRNQFYQTQLVHGNDFWFLKPAFRSRKGEESWYSLSFVRMDLHTGNTRTYTLEELTGKDQVIVENGEVPRYNVYEDAQGNVLLFLTPLNEILQLDQLTGKFISLPFFPVRDIPASRDVNTLPLIQQDMQGNFLFLYKTSGSIYHTILWDTTGKYFDYSHVVNSALEKMRFPEGNVHSILARDFKREAHLFFDGGIAVLNLQLSGAVSTYLEQYSTRAILPSGTRRYFVNPENMEPVILDLNEGASTVTPFRPDCPSGIELFWASDVRKDSGGAIWIPNSRDDAEMLRIAPDLSCTGYEIEAEFGKFDFLSSHEIVSVSENQVFRHDIKNGLSSPWVGEGTRPAIQSEQVNQIYCGSEDVVWIATLEGLWFLDYKTNQSRRFGLEDGFRDERMMCLDEDAKGRIWAGTYGAGLHIFDPGSGEISIIERKDGLSNNTVISILQDRQGVRWLATYDGITLISEKGEVVSHLYEEDGLSTNEFNRYSSATDNGGRLLFGSVAGVNVIEPEAVKNQLLQPKDLRIFLTGLTYYQNQKGQDVTLRNHFNTISAIKLPASHRYLRIRYALTSLVRPEENRYAYKIRFADKPEPVEWNYVGQNQELNLYNLPAGEYDLLIRGSDYRGNWTSEPIELRINAPAFFYKQIWFYALIFLLLSTIGMAWTWREISERKRLEKLVAERTRKIKDDKKTIEAQATKLREVDEAKSRFFTNISHEFRTPLTVISGIAQQLKEDPNEWGEEGLELIDRNSSQLLSLINQILDLRKLESGVYSLQPVLGDIIPFLEQINQSFIPAARKKGIKMQFHAGTDELFMDYDPDKMLHVISNLISNAIKYSDAGDEVEFRVEEKSGNPGTSLCIQVRDTGHGISARDLPYIFDRFYRVEGTAAPKPVGSGIGLSLTKELVDLFGGTINVNSQPGKGTTFTLLFPVTKQAPAMASRQKDADQMAALEQTTGIYAREVESLVPGEKDISFKSENGNGSGPILLVVEDNPDVMLYIRRILAPHYRLILAENGQEGIDMAIENVPDLIVSDVMMPVRDGYALCNTLKHDERTSHIPIILLTAKADQDSKLSGLRRGADAYLTKPFEKEELLLRLENLTSLRERWRQRYESLSLDDLQSAPGGNQLEDDFLLKLHKVVIEHISDEDFNVPDLCRAMGVSRTQLHNKLKALTGKSTSQVVRTIRLNEARKLLETTDLNVSEVGYEVGISNPAYFSRIYSEEFGEPPGKTRK